MSELKTHGCREWVGIPDLAIRRIRAKLDTGTKSSSIHAFDVEILNGDNGSCVRFKIAARQRNEETLVQVQVEPRGTSILDSPSPKAEESPI